jgi:chromosome segregation ATPase
VTNPDLTAELLKQIRDGQHALRADMIERFSRTNATLEGMGARLDRMDARLDRTRTELLEKIGATRADLLEEIGETNARLDQTNAKLDQTNARLGRLEGSVAELVGHVSTLADQSRDLHGRVQALGDRDGV